MRFFDIEWTDFIERLTEWEQLSKTARRAFVDLAANKAVKVAAFDGVAPDLVSKGFLSPLTDGRRVRINEECRHFSRAIRAVDRHDIFGSPSEGTLLGYLRDCFTARHLSMLVPRHANSSYGYGYGHAADLVHRVRSVGWVKGLLAADDGVAWKRRDIFGESPLSQSDLFGAVQQMVGKFQEFSGPIPLRDVPSHFAEVPEELLQTAILVSIKCLYLFPAMRSDDMTPIIGLWPEIARRLRRPKLKQPNPLEPNEFFHSPFLIDDMTTILVAAAARPLRVRVNDQELFAKAQSEIESNLVSTPRWIDAVGKCSPPGRIQTALLLLRALTFVQMDGVSGRKLALVPTKDGNEWLAANDKNRLMIVLDQLKTNISELIERGMSRSTGHYGVLSYDRSGSRRGFMGTFRFDLMPFHLKILGRVDWDLLKELAAVFETLDGSHFVRFVEFADWHSQELNPVTRLLDAEPQLRVRVGYETYEPTEELSEILWWNTIANFAFDRLIPLGGLRVGVVGENRELCISLTEIGRYLMSLVEDFDFGQENDETKPILVQPNFDVVFRSPSPRNEASIGRFSQRKGHRVGTLFQITKKSILAAACTGMTDRQVLEVLQHASVNEIPANVKREIQGWFGQCRRVSVRKATLVHCPDVQTAARVRAAGGKKATAISDTVIELTGSKRDTALFRKLEAMGIFAD